MLFFMVPTLIMLDFVQYIAGKEDESQGLAYPYQNACLVMTFCSAHSICSYSFVFKLAQKSFFISGSFIGLDKSTSMPLEVFQCLQKFSIRINLVMKKKYKLHLKLFGIDIPWLSQAAGKEFQCNQCLEELESVILYLFIHVLNVTCLDFCFI